MGIKQFASFNISGIDEYLARVEQAGREINGAVAKAVEASAEPISAEIEQWAQKHKITGATEGGVIKPKAIIEGNNIYCEAGISGEGESWHAVFVEYGSPRNRADPGIRNAFSSNKKKVRQIQVQVLKKEGAPADE